MPTSCGSPVRHRSAYAASGAPLKTSELCHATYRGAGNSVPDRGRRGFRLDVGRNEPVGWLARSGPTLSIGTSASSCHTPSARSRVKGYAALCARPVVVGRPNSASRSASRCPASDQGSRLLPVDRSRPRATSASRGLCGERLPSCSCRRRSSAAGVLGPSRLLPLRGQRLRRPQTVVHHLAASDLATSARSRHDQRVRATIVLGQQGRLVVPAEVRKELGLAAGDELVLHAEAGRLVIERRGDAAKRLRGLYSSPATEGAVEELLAERRQAAAGE